MNPKSTSAADSMLARTGRRIAVSESFICASFLRKVNRPDGPQRNGTSHARVPSLSCLYVERERGQSTLAGPVCVRTEGPEHTPKRGRPARGRPKRHNFAVGTRDRPSRFESTGRAGRMAKAPVLKTGGRKPLQVR